jgi:hypothetical protein
MTVSGDSADEPAITTEVDREWLAALRAAHDNGDPVPPWPGAPQPSGLRPDRAEPAEGSSAGDHDGVATTGNGSSFDDQRTIGSDADLLADVREAVRQARQRLAEPPQHPDPAAHPLQPLAPPSPADDEVPQPLPPPAGDEVREALQPFAAPQPSLLDPLARRLPPGAPTGGDPLLPLLSAPPAASGAIAGPQQPFSEARSAVEAGALAVPTSPPATAPPTGGGTRQPVGERWRPPARLKPAATPTSAALLVEESPPRHARRWIVLAAAAAIVVAGVIVLVAVRSGGSSPSDQTGSTSVVPTTALAPGRGAVTTSAVAKPTPTVAAVTTLPTTVATTTVLHVPTIAAAPSTAPATVEPAAVPSTVAAAPDETTAPAGVVATGAP